MNSAFYGRYLQGRKRNLNVSQAEVQREFIALMGKSLFKAASASAQTTL